MILIIHDQPEMAIEKITRNISDKTIVIFDNGKITPCICCFGCWIKTPGKCVIDDGYNNIGKLLSQCNGLIIISRCFYGSYSPFVKNVLDRSIPYILPYFKTKKGITSHPKRYDNNFFQSVYFYGEATEQEKETAQKLVKVGSISDNKTHVFFCKSFDEIQVVL